MKAIVMAGGFGTRLRPLTINVPKPMVPICNAPMMEHVVALLKRHGITEITSVLYFQADAIRDYFGDGSAFGVSMSYAKPDEDFGTAGAVRYALTDASEPVLVISGDLATDFDLSEAINWHREKQSEATVLLTRMENPLPYGITITDTDGRIVRFLEKPSWGEAFSDTINTGIYIMEPAAIKMIPPRTNFDFSQNLFPLLLARKMGLYGKIMTGYWKDVGNVDEYYNAHIDYIEGRLHIDLNAECSEGDGHTVCKGKNVHIDNDVKLTGKVIIGNDVTIQSGAELHNCVIGHRSRIGRRCKIKGTIIWSDNQIGDETVMHRSIVCDRSRLGQNVQLLDNVIVADDCVIGESATVKANCKIWPGKVVDSGAIVSSSVVWGEKWNRELFSDSKITGLGLTELTPEMSVKLGGAFGAFVGMGEAVLISRDASDTSRLLKRGLISGLLGAGANVADIETLPVPVVRFGMTQGDYAAGIYVRHNPQDYRLIDCIFFDRNGLDLPTVKAKKVERMYFGEDFERASLDSIGHLDYPQRVLEDYRRGFHGEIDSDIIKEAGFKVIVDHSNGASSQIFPTLFFELGISATELNANLNPRKFSASPEEHGQAMVQLSSIVKSLNADIGFLLNSAAEKLMVVDEQGQPVDNQLLLLIVTDLFLQTHEARKIAVPVDSSMGIEELAKEYGVEVVRVANDHLAMMQIYRGGEVDFVGGTRGGFLQPRFQVGADAMLSTVRILEMMARTRTQFGAARQKFAHLHRRSVSVPCPWSRKGTVMRKLITGSESKDRQLIDGIRIFEDSGWVLVAPDRQTAAFNIMAESTSVENTDQLVAQYRELVETSQHGD